MRHAQEEEPAQAPDEKTCGAQVRRGEPFGLHGDARAKKEREDRDGSKLERANEYQRDDLVRPAGFGLGSQDLFEQRNPEQGLDIDDEYAKERDSAQNIDMGVSAGRRGRLTLGALAHFRGGLWLAGPPIMRITRIAISETPINRPALPRIGMTPG